MPNADDRDKSRTPMNGFRLPMKRSAFPQYIFGTGRWARQVELRAVLLMLARPPVPADVGRRDQVERPRSVDTAPGGSLGSPSAGSAPSPAPPGSPLPTQKSSPFEYTVLLTRIPTAVSKIKQITRLLVDIAPGIDRCGRPGL